MLTPIVMGRFLIRGNMVLVRNLRSYLSEAPLLIPGCPWLSCERVDGLDRCRELLGLQLPRRQSSTTTRGRLPQMSRELRCKGQENLLRYRQPELVLVYRILYITSIRPHARSDVTGFFCLLRLSFQYHSADNHSFSVNDSAMSDSPQ